MGTSESVSSREHQQLDTTCATLPRCVTEQYEVLSTVGKGAFGTVYKVRDTRTKIIFALKQMEYNDSNRKEVEIQAGLDDDHVVRIHDTIPLMHERELFVVMEYCEAGNLMQWIRRIRKHHMVTELLVLHMLTEICEAVYSCHQKNIIHRDLKPENVLLDHRRRVKLADFGVARIVGNTSVAKSFCGTPPYIAPELFLSYMSLMNTGHLTGYDAKCDVWSIGCILWDMSNHKDLFVYQLGTSLGYSVAQDTTENNSTLEISRFIEQDIPQDFLLTKQILHQMLKKVPAERISLSELLQNSELHARLENPSNGHWSDIYRFDANTVS